ncbi:alpha/beta fold hydrolase [Pseudomonas chlororaphis]|uniref:alpha/beta fold hydrolase n=1 Tax=Pseudomonas chlororaphis TaxID=587753 RepID=UPI0015DE61FD|nr:alpha/beta hydrolase [Pseudomonas chlororaphis]QLL16105.1 alpha/beta hydrolase [Pseudomonas chlororaphis subsp. aurantiaca]
MQERKKLVILPGWSNDGDRLWQYQIQHLAEQYDIETIVVSNQSNASDMADEVLRRAPETFILLGHSLGGFIAQHVAIKAPERVERLILVGTFPGNVPDEQRTFFKQGMLEPLREGAIPEDYWQTLNPSCVDPERAEDGVLLAQMAAGQNLSCESLINQTNVLISAQDISEKLPAADMPTLIIYGAQDQLFSKTMQELMLDKLPNATLEVVEDCGHMPSIERPMTVTKLLVSWLASDKNTFR